MEPGEAGSPASQQPLFRVPRSCSRSQALELRSAAHQPSQAPLTRIARVRFIRLTGNDVIELHDHVGAEVALDAHHRLRREAVLRAVDVTAELDAVLVDGAQRLQREHLEAAGVGEDRAVPAHEPVQPAERRARARRRGAGADDRRWRGSSGADRVAGRRVERLDRRERADGHERRRLDGAMRRHEDAGASGAGGSRSLEGERHACLTRSLRALTAAGPRALRPRCWARS